jgi:hypothetical protein
VRRGRARAAAALVAFALLLPGCGAVRAFVTTQAALENAGYDVVKVGYENPDVLTVTWRPRGGDLLLHVEALGGARIVWRVTPFRIEAVRMIPQGSGDDEYFHRAELERAFGPRPPGRDDKTFEQLVDVRGLAAGAAVAVLLGLGLVVLIVVLVVRGRRKAAAPWAAGWQPAGSWPPAGPTPEDPFRSPESRS